MSRRLETYVSSRARLEAMSDESLVDSLSRSSAREGCGAARILDVDGTFVFAKSIPLTSEEQRHPGCTENLFGIPSFYHYGVGSLGFGVYRELAVQQKTTDWVLRGESGSFPLLYHHRILPFSGEVFAMNDAEIDEYVAYWDGCPQIRDYVQARRASSSHVVMFLEYIPHTLKNWLGENLGQLETVMTAVKNALELLRDKGVGHFDAHWGNILTDGQQVYVTDFGLALDSEWPLDTGERAFLTSHRHYDEATFIRSLSRPLWSEVVEWEEATKESARARIGELRMATLIDNLDSIDRIEGLSLPAEYRRVLTRYRDVIATMDQLFTALRRGPKLDAGYSDDELRAALSST